MDNLSRTGNSIKNTIYGILTQILTVLISFATRTVFIEYLSVEYLGVNGLFTNILTVLSLTELGFGGAMIYSMYLPLAVQDHNKLRGLMNFFSKIYTIIGVVFGVFGLFLIPFLSIFIKDTPNISNLTLIYLLFLANSVASYFYAFKRSILQADQKQFIISKNSLIFTFIKAILQVIILIIFKSYLLFLTIQVVITITENLFISQKVKAMYPYLKNISESSLDSFEKTAIWTNVKALMIYKVGSTVLDGTDNIIISSLIGIATVGYLSNYTLIVGSVSMILQQITNALTGSIGNFVATEEVDKQEDLFNRIVFIYFFIYGFSFVALFMLLNPFITIWIGKEYILPNSIVFVIAFNCYITGIMNPVWTFRSTKGLFIHGKMRPLISAIINVVVSIILAIYWGLIGVLIGTTITRLTTNFWYDSYIIFRHGFKKSPKLYYINQLLYFISLSIPFILLEYLFRLISFGIYASFITQIVLVVVITIGSILLIYWKTEELNYFKKILIKLIVK
jgi:O-antigen/teichoic acid export membrane protein